MSSDSTELQISCAALLDLRSGQSLRRPPPWRGSTRSAAASPVPLPLACEERLGASDHCGRRSRAQQHRHQRKMRIFRLGALSCVGPPGLGGVPRVWKQLCPSVVELLRRVLEHHPWTTKFTRRLTPTPQDIRGRFPSSVPTDRTQWCIDRHESCEQQFSLASKWWNPREDEGSFWSTVSHVTPASVREYIALAPLCDVAPAPVFGYISPAPVGYAAPAPVVDYIAPVPAVYAAPTPVGEFISPAPGGYAAPTPVIEDIAHQPTFRCKCQKPADDCDARRKSAQKCGQDCHQSETETKVFDWRTSGLRTCTVTQLQDCCGERKFEAALLKQYLEHVTTWECLYGRQQSQLSLFKTLDDIKMAGQKEHVDQTDLPAESRTFWDCTQREEEVDHHAVQAEAGVLRRLTITEVTIEKQNANSSQPITAWRHEEEDWRRGEARRGHAEKGVDRYCELAV